MWQITELIRFTVPLTACYKTWQIENEMKRNLFCLKYGELELQHNIDRADILPDLACKILHMFS